MLYLGHVQIAVGKEEIEMIILTIKSLIKTLLPICGIVIGAMIIDKLTKGDKD
jgi:hypothetical protein